MTLRDPVELVAAALGCDVTSLSADSGLNMHPQWDSLGHVAVMTELESAYGIVIDDETIRRYVAMSAIISLHRERLRQEG